MNEALVRHIVERMRPSFQADGHDIEIIGFTPENELKVSVCGHCEGGCLGSKVLMGLEIERAVQRKVPELKKVLVVPRQTCVPEALAGYL